MPGTTNNSEKGPSSEGNIKTIAHLDGKYITGTVTQDQLNAGPSVVTKKRASMVLATLGDAAANKNEKGEVVNTTFRGLEDPKLAPKNPTATAVVANSNNVNNNNNENALTPVSQTGCCITM